MQYKLVDEDAKYEMRFTKDCLENVSLNMLVYFVHEFPEQLFKLNLDGIDWLQLFDEKLASHRIERTRTSQLVTPKGDSLLSICVANEQKEGAP